MSPLLLDKLIDFLIKVFERIFKKNPRALIEKEKAKLDEKLKESDTTGRPN